MKTDLRTKTFPRRCSKKARLVNRKQKLCVVLGMIVAVGMTVYPPWVLRLFDARTIRSERHVGYRWLWAPPKVRWEPSGTKSIIVVTPDIVRLCAQGAVVAVSTAGLMVALKDNQNRKVRVAPVVIVLITILLSVTLKNRAF